MQLTNGKELQHGKYRIIGILGQGGFGITYLAEQTSLGRKVAIKEFFMKEHCNRDNNTSQVSVGTIGSKDLVERFKQKFLKEARTIASFTSSNIVNVFDVFEENGTAYYVMEYLEGKSLKRLVDENGTLPEEVAVKYIRQVCNALKEVHENNMLHLDVKPANIMLDKKGNAVLIDFGISKHYDESGAQTSSAGVGISEGFAPLEQYEASSLKEFTPATDIYALGATLFFLLNGTRPPKASYIYDEGLPPMPEKLSLALRKAIEGAMQPRRKDRPQNVNEFLKLVEGEEEKKDIAVTSFAKEQDSTSLSMEHSKKTANNDNPNTEDLEVEVIEATPYIPSSSPKPEDNKKKGKWLWAIILLLLVICGALGGFILFNNGNEKERKNEKETSEQVIEEPDSAKKDSAFDASTEQAITPDTLVAQVKNVQPTPSAEQTAKLIIKGAPDGANVYVGGNYFGTTPLGETNISLGEHIIKIVKEGYETYEKRHTFNGRNTPITVNLLAKAKPQAKQSTSAKGTINGHAYVDLGLPSGIKWATCNVGASNPEGYGNYYAWGEVTTKSNYIKENNSSYGKDLGNIGGNSRYDVARKEWGSSWRLPTKAEFDELLAHCEWTWTTLNGVKGYKVKSKKNGNSIFFPAAGWHFDVVKYQGIGGYYWTYNASSKYGAYFLSLLKSKKETKSFGRENGISVRPVSGNAVSGEIHDSYAESTNKKSSADRINSHEYVDLGLPSGIKWATCNVGASKPEGYGNYYAWGETATKSRYSNDNSITYGKNVGDIGGNSQYDVARKEWGSSWRLPTKAEFDELLAYCEWTWTTLNGIKGYEVRSKKNGNSIFLPAAGWNHEKYDSFHGTAGHYWCSSPKENNAYGAYLLHILSSKKATTWHGRETGQSIRPVYGSVKSSENKGSYSQTTNKKTVTSKVNGHECVDLGLPSGIKWATCNVGASKPEGYGKYYAWGEVTTKSNYIKENNSSYGKNLGYIGGNSRYDVARKEWGSSWRLPTKEEFDELLAHCEWTWTTLNGVKGYEVRSKKNGNSIFFPAAGWHFDVVKYQGTGGYYWTYTPNTEYGAYFLFLLNNMKETRWFGRENGISVRPVCK